ncbi:hypothetical protein [Salinicola avicenniae]|uniref:hypothetical protein n=1 Tax=Salinicola avicenniae TaxID=2916836 RepID=UPI002073A660|nr:MULTISPECIES: hypothetical protein [unclassified Salinicola]
MNDSRGRLVPRTPLLMGLGIGMGLLGGCQTMPEPTAPAGADTLPAACRWNAEGESLARLRATRDALESRGYEILDTDASLGLVSAERRTRQPGLGAVNSPYGRTGFWGGFGLGGRHGYSIGMIQGFGGGYNTDPVQIERVSVVTPDTTTLVDRDSVVVDYDGYLIDARAYNQPTFCESLRDDIAQRLNRATPATTGETP